MEGSAWIPREEGSGVFYNKGAECLPRRFIPNIYLGWKCVLWSETNDHVIIYSLYPLPVRTTLLFSFRNIFYYCYLNRSSRIQSWYVCYGYSKLCEGTADGECKCFSVVFEIFGSNDVIHFTLSISLRCFTKRPRKLYGVSENKTSRLPPTLSSSKYVLVRTCIELCVVWC